MNNQKNLDSDTKPTNYQPRLKKGHVQDSSQNNNIEHRQADFHPPNIPNRNNQSNFEKPPQATKYQGIRQDHQFGDDKKLFSNYWSNKQQII